MENAKSVIDSIVNPSVKNGMICPFLWMSFLNGFVSDREIFTNMLLFDVSAEIC